MEGLITSKAALKGSQDGHSRTSVFGGSITRASDHQAAITLCRVSAPAVTAPSANPVVRKSLAANPVLGALTEQDLRALLLWSRICTLKRRDIICRQGASIHAVIVVLEGYVKLSRLLPDGGEVLLEIAGPNDSVGELAVLARQPHDTDVTALSPCRLLLLDARQFRLVFDRRPEGLLAVLRLATGRLRQVTEQLVDNRALTVSARLAKALLRLTGLQSFGSNSPASLLFSQRELANMTGACREVVNKQLGTWRAAGWIRMSAGTVTSVHATALSNELEHNVGYKS